MEKKVLLACLDRITEQTAVLSLADEREIALPLADLPQGADEGMVFTLTIERNEEEEKKLAQEIAALRNDLLK